MVAYRTDSRFAMVPPGASGGSLRELEEYIHGDQKPEEVAPGLYYDRRTGKFLRKEEEIARAMGTPAPPEAVGMPERPPEPTTEYGEPEVEAPPPRLFEKPEDIPLPEEPVNMDALPEKKRRPAPDYGDNYYYDENGELTFDAGLNTEQMERVGLQVEAGAKDLSSGMLASIGAILKQAAEYSVSAELEGTGRLMTDLMLQAAHAMTGGRPSKKELEKKYAFARKAGEDLIRAAKSDIWDPDPKLKAKNDNAIATYMEDFFRMTPQMAGQIAASLALGPVGGGVYIGAYITGTSYLQYREDGVEHDRALGAAFANAVMQAPLETFGIGKITKYFNLRNLAYKKWRQLGKDMGTEWFTEFSQGVPDLIATVFAKGADKTKLEMANQFLEELGPALQQSAYEGLLTAPWALIGAGGQGISRRKAVSKLKKGGFTDEDIQWLEDHPGSTPLDLVNIKFKEEGVDVANAILVNQLGEARNVAQQTQEELWAAGYPVAGVENQKKEIAEDRGRILHDNEEFGEQEEAALRYEEELAEEEARNEAARIVQDQYEFFKEYNRAELEQMEREGQAAEIIPGEEIPEITDKVPTVEEAAEVPVAEEAAEEAAEEPAEAEAKETPFDEILDEPAVSAAAIKMKDGTIFTGKTHYEAFEKIPIEEQGDIENDEGFVDQRGNFLTREEAVKATKAPGEDAADVVGRPIIPQPKVRQKPKPPVQVGLFEDTAETLAEKPKKVRRKVVGSQGKLMEKTLQAAGKTTKTAQGLFESVQKQQQKAKKASRIDFLKDEAMKLPEKPRKAILRHLERLEQSDKNEPKMLYQGPPKYRWTPSAIKRGMLLKPHQVTEEKFKEIFPILEKSSEDLIEAEKPMKVAMMDAVTGRVFAYEIGSDEVWNHADIFIKHDLDAETAITGFQDEEGTFYYQYPKDAHRAHINAAWHRGDKIPFRVLEEYGKFKKKMPKKEAARKEVKPDIAFDSDGHINLNASATPKAISLAAKRMQRDIRRKRAEEDMKATKSFPKKLTNMEKMFLVRIRNGMKRYFDGKEPDLQPTDLKIHADDTLTDDHKITREIFRRLGTEVVFFEFDDLPEWNKRFGGMHDHGVVEFKRVIFVNSQTVKGNLLATAGHEWMHLLEVNEPELYEKFKDFVMTLHPEIRRYEMQRKADFDEEFMADVVGNIMKNEDFWDALYAYDPAMHTALWKRLYEAVSRCLAAIRDMIREYEAYPENMKKAAIIGREQDAISFLKKGEQSYEELRDRLIEMISKWQEVDWYDETLLKGKTSVLYKDFDNRTIDMHFNMSQVGIDDPMYDKFKDKIGKIEEPLGRRIGMKMRELRKGFYKNFVDKALPFKEKLDDQLGITDKNKMTYTLKRMETNLQSVLSAFWENGGLDWDFDSPSPIVTKKGKGIKPLMRRMGQHRELFFHWMVANRAAALKEEKREQLFEKEEIEAIQKGVKDLGMEGQFKEWRKEFDEIKQSVLRFAETAGIISPNIREIHDTADYIPFMRVLDDKFDGEMFWAADAKKVKRFIDSRIRRLKGGKENLGDPIENIFENWTYLINESIKNRTRVKALDYMLQLKLANPVKIATEKIAWEEMTEDEKKILMNWYNQRGVIGAMKDGKKHFVMVHDAELYDALVGLDHSALDNWVFNLMGSMKRMLTFGVTFAPAFKIANTIRDTMSGFVTQPGFTPFVDSAKGFWHIIKKDNMYWEAMASGALFSQGYVQADNPKAMAKYIREEVGSIKDLPMYNPVNWARQLLQAWEAVGDATENAARLQDYVNNRSAGKTKFEAGYSAKDLLDFTSSGQSQVVQALIRMVPFLNARMQGLYKLRRAYGENKRAFTAKGALLMAATIALWMYNKDDERWKELPPHERYMYYHFWIGDVHFRIPKPFEVGAIFSSFPEEVYGSIYKYTTKEATAGDASRDFLSFMASTFRDTFAFNPVPQIVKPVAETTFNIDMFTWTPIEGLELKGRSPGQRYKRYTSETMKWIGDKANMSPVKMEHLLRGYTGELGMYVLGMSDIAFKNLTDREDPAPRIQDREFVGKVLGRFIRTGPQRSVEYVEKLYRMIEDSNQMTRDLNVFKQMGDLEKAKAALEDDKWLYKNRSIILRIRKYMREYNDKVEKIYNSGMAPEEKRKRLDDLAEQRNKVTREIWLKLVESRRKE